MPLKHKTLEFLVSGASLNTSNFHENQLTQIKADILNDCLFFFKKKSRILQGLNLESVSQLILLSIYQSIFIILIMSVAEIYFPRYECLGYK